MGGGNADGVVFALNPECTQMMYGSFVGGSNTDAAYGIQVNGDGNIVICGGTKSSNFPTTAGAFKTTAPGSGDWDGFVSVINPQSGNLLSSTYLGTTQDDQATHVQVDVGGNVYVLGRTFGNYPISPGVYSVPGSDLFIQKLDPNLGTSMLSTRLGNPQNGGTPFFPTAFLVDNCTNVYVTGLTSNYEVPLSNMPLTADAFQTTPGNFWFGVLKPGFSGLLFGTYFGRINDTINHINGDHTHVGANHFDPKGILYQSLCVNSHDYPGTTPQSWSQFNQNTVGQDIVSFKFAFQLAGVTSGFHLAVGQSDSGCAPFTVHLENTSSMATEYTWDFGDGQTSTDPNPSHTYQSEGNFTISLHAHNDTTCITDAVSTRTITVFDPQIPDITAYDTLVCNAEQVIPLEVTVHNPSVHNSFLWQPATGIIGPDNQQTITINPNLNTVYTITVWDTIAGFCGYRATDTVHIDYKPRALDIVNNDTLVCLGTYIPIAVIGTNGYSYQWTPIAGVTSPTSQNPQIRPDSSTTYTLTASYPGCADTAQSIRIAVDYPISASFRAEPDSICTGRTITFLPQTDSTAIALHWQWGDGTGMNGPNEKTLQHAYDSAGIMEVKLTTQFRACPDTSFMDTVYVYALPKVYLGPDTSLCLNGSPLILQNQQPEEGVMHHYLWNTGDTSESLKIVHPGTYSLRISNEPLGCSTKETIKITKDCYIDIPNAFSPNGDGENDYFFPRQLLSKRLSGFRMQVFNRWGQVVFETERKDGRGWDGTFNGKPQPQGVYIYLVDADFVNGRKENYKGNVTLLR
jgi:gliding motility-associated-like protein